MNLLILLLLLLTIISVGYYCFAIYAAIDFFSRPSKINHDFYPPVTILTPICGLEWELETSLISFCQQDYPRYQIIFCLQNQSDPCLNILKKIKNNFPDLDINIVTNPQAIGNNLKISNLANAVAIIKYPILVITDSDIQVKPNYLQQVVEPLQDNSVGLVTCLYTSLTKGFLAAFEALEISTQFHPRVLTAKKIEGIQYAFGSTIVIRKKILEEIGGFLGIADYLADDYQLGNLVSKLGYRVILSDYLVAHRLADVTWRSFFQRQSRWAKCIRVERFWGYLGLIFTQGTVISLALLIATGGVWWSWLICLITWTIRMLMAIIVGVKLLKDQVAKKYLILVPIRDLVSFWLWCYNLVGNTVNWRDYKFELAKGGKLIKLEVK
ncbi:bacteriohopanetetrol glucosamine biosynthesis glycosyltransferase HpnI [Gloeocapsa sp. PCC 73106]|uniref:bacteriohopanetetrol glucosamine biosynthesis glycosyltransferase HpnI n=1 Tax=Gloeocapsa sp. PCC 73106 TaxID=102232 RepID=UPI0002ABEE1A|nr:bacteriohopanetetrol glucosamine biosynthesis glycosyltransferase HpnI [Gloeocapsa sp. PCC 73106]ELR98270.1 hopanoid biosynthesis associated glycosyl transferase protein HpnI [Gloeocapsa sp. PCC 73106]